MYQTQGVTVSNPFFNGEDYEKLQMSGFLCSMKPVNRIRSVESMNHTYKTNRSCFCGSQAETKQVTWLSSPSKSLSSSLDH